MVDKIEALKTCDCMWEVFTSLSTLLIASILDQAHITLRKSAIEAIDTLLGNRALL